MSVSYRPGFFSSLAEPELMPDVHDFVHNWDETGVANWLKSISLGQYGDIFRRHNITGQVLLEIDPSILKDMGIKKVGDRVRLATHIKTFRNTECQRISRSQLNRESLDLLESATSAHSRSRQSSRSDIQSAVGSNIYIPNQAESPYVDSDNHMTTRFLLSPNSLASPIRGQMTPGFPPHSASLSRMPMSPDIASQRFRTGSYTGSQSSLLPRHLRASPSLELASPTNGQFLPSDKPLIRVIFENANSSVVNIDGCKTADDVMLKSLRKGQLNESQVKSYCFYTLDGVDPDPLLCRRLSDSELMVNCTDPNSWHRGRLILRNIQTGPPDIDQVRAAAKIASQQLAQAQKANHVMPNNNRSQLKVEQLTGEPLSSVLYQMSPNSTERFDAGTIPLPSSPQSGRPVSKLKELWGGRPPSELIASDLKTYFPQYEKSEIDRTVRMSIRRSRRISRATSRLSTYSNFSMMSRDIPPLPSISDAYLGQGARSFRPLSVMRMGGMRDSLTSSFLDPLEEESPADEGSQVPFVTFTPTAGPGPSDSELGQDFSLGDGQPFFGSDNETDNRNSVTTLMGGAEDWNKRISQIVQEDSDEEDTELSDYLENNSWDNVKYMKGALIGQGSFGSVYLALHAVTGELMAVKQVELPAESEKDSKKDTMIEALKHEIGLLRELKHENIVQYLGSNSDDTHLNIFLEYVPGGSVAKMLVNYGPLPEGMIQSFVKQILKGLSYLHSQDIIHRDIKGANILVDNKGAVKISDFGISKRVETTSTLLSNNSKKVARVSMQGSVFWMAPEVVKQTSYTKKADIWSLGCLVIEMLTGSHPHPNCSQIQAIFKIGSTDCSPTVPDEASDVMKEFLKATFEIQHEMRPSAEELLQSSFCTAVLAS